MRRGLSYNKPGEHGFPWGPTSRLVGFRGTDWGEKALAVYTFPPFSSVSICQTT
jgi:hypothetical protein